MAKNPDERSIEADKKQLAILIRQAQELRNRAEKLIEKSEQLQTRILKRESK
jgi:hypothetical protein